MRLLMLLFSFDGVAVAVVSQVFEAFHLRSHVWVMWVAVAMRRARPAALNHRSHSRCTCPSFTVCGRSLLPRPLQLWAAWWRRRTTLRCLAMRWMQSICAFFRRASVQVYPWGDQLLQHNYKDWLRL